LVLSAESFRWKARRRERARQKSFCEVDNYARLSADLQREARGEMDFVARRAVAECCARIPFSESLLRFEPQETPDGA
jgi:hypothetical protein